MRQIKLSLVLFVVAAILTIPAVSSFALSGKYSGTINFVYTSNSEPPVSLINITYASGSSSVTSNFIIPSSISNTIIAMALTAQASGKGVSFQTDGSSIYALWVNSN